MASYRRVSEGKHPRGNQEWKQRPSFNSMQSQRGFVAPLNPLMRPQMHVPISPFANNPMSPDMASATMYVQDSTPPNPLIRSQFPDPDLQKKIVKQIDYYFSNENLVKDIYLRQKMDEQGWVPVNLIASFKRVSSLTNNVHLILEANADINYCGSEGYENEKAKCMDGMAYSKIT